MSEILTPPDFNQCQAEKPNGVTFMTMGGQFKMERCGSIPEYIVHELTPDEDGQCGCMSLCSHCKDVFITQLASDMDKYEFTSIMRK
jgi:hypothetical protein